MDNMLKVIELILSIFLPICFGYFIKKLNIFKESEIEVLKRFVIKITIPFIIFKNLFEADITSIKQSFPAASGLLLLTILFSITGYLISNKISTDKKKQNTYPFSVMAGNYAFLGWGVMYSFFGKEAFTRAVFFSILFWPTFLLCGFWLIYKMSHHSSKGQLKYISILQKNASIPFLSAIFAIFLNLSHFNMPKTAWALIDKFSVITIPMILFTIGLNLSFRINLSQAKIILAASAHRLVFGFGLGFLVTLILRLFFPVDLVTLKVILMQSTMPTAAMSPFFADYIKMDKKLLSSIITFSTLLSMITIPLWYIVIEYIL